MDGQKQLNPPQQTKNFLMFMKRIYIKLVEKKLKSKKVLKIADFGGGIGAVTDKIKVDHNKKKAIYLTCFDSNKELLKLNKSADSKIWIDIKKPLGKNKYDIGIMRYVLNYNNKKDQLKILNNINESLNNSGIFINWWCGVSSIKHQRIFQKLFNTRKINSRLFRLNSHWTTWKENKELFGKAGFYVKIVKKYNLPIKHLYKIRYKLSEKENEDVLKFLGKYKFINYVIFIATKKK